MKAILRGAKAAFAIAAIAMLGACATGANKDAMTVGTTPAMIQAVPQPLRGQVTLKEVVGGQETNPLWKSNISSSDFQAALDASLRNAGLAAADANAARYELSASLQDVKQPVLGFNMTVTATVRYDLVERATGKMAWQMTIARPFTAKVGDAFLGVERLRVANEGAARVNIEGFLDALAKSGPRP